jgi:hypothetical protein
MLRILVQYPWLPRRSRLDMELKTAHYPILRPRPGRSGDSGFPSISISTDALSFEGCQANARWVLAAWVPLTKVISLGFWCQEGGGIVDHALVDSWQYAVLVLGKNGIITIGTDRRRVRYCNTVIIRCAPWTTKPAHTVITKLEVSKPRGDRH